MTQGILNLKTNGGERKMHYLYSDNKYYMLTPLKSNKIAQIKADANVFIDLDDKQYHAEVYTDETVLEVKEMFQSVLKGFTKFFNKYIGKKNDAVIILTVK